LVSYFVSRLVG